MLSSFAIFSDSTSDLTSSQCSDNDIHLLQLGVSIPGIPNSQTQNISTGKFYQLLTPQRLAKTSAVNPGEYKSFFRASLMNDQDVLYLGFSSTMSSSFQNSLIAASELQEQFPTKRIICIDTKSVAPGLGMLVKLAVKERNAGKDIDEVAAIVRQSCLKMAHWFSVDDFSYLKAGGRISPTMADIAKILKVYPIMHFDESGVILKHGTTRGTNATLRSLAKIAHETNIEENFVIAHGNAPEKAKKLADYVREKMPNAKIEFARIGPIIGAHVGPSAIAIFFFAKDREYPSK